jgi:hypothetical protein
MPHDRDGKPLNVGDQVLVPARVKEIHMAEEFCNVSLETSQPMYPSNNRTTLTLNAKQVVKAAIAVLLAVLLGGRLARADDSERNAGPVVVGITGGGMMNLPRPTNPDQAKDVTPEAFVHVDGPLPLGQKALGRIEARLGFTSLPGQPIDPEDVSTFSAAEVDLGVYHVLGLMNVGSQVITLSGIGEWGFSSILPSTPEATTRLLRRYGFGVRLEERTSGASVTVLYGRNEAAGPRRYGQWILYGQVPITGTHGALMLVGDATLSVGPQPTVDPADPTQLPFVPQQDLIRVGLTTDLGRVLDLLKGNK